MRQYRIRGRRRLSGELCVGGAKNAVLPILAAVCLNESETVINNTPRIADTFATIEILKGIGCRVEFNKNTLKVNSFGDLSQKIPDEFAKKMRSSVLFAGAMLARGGRVEIAFPGGCSIGKRAIDLHIAGLRAMGAEIEVEDDRLLCNTSGLFGAKIKLDFPSVGATENLLIAAVTAKGETVIENAAREPEISDLALFLKNLGADIRGAGTSTIAINGVKKLRKKNTHEVMPDRIVAGTYLAAAAISVGEIALSNVRPFDLSPFSSFLSEMGCHMHADDAAGIVTLRAPKRLRAVPRITTRVHPGFPTDMQAQFVAALSVAEGISEITETIFEGRLSHVSELRKMGAKIKLTADKQTFIVSGVKRLKGATVAAHDLRCGAALILAGLAAEGETLVKNAEYVERGYERIEEDLAALGADISTEEASVPSEGAENIEAAAA